MINILLMRDLFINNL